MVLQAPQPLGKTLWGTLSLMTIPESYDQLHRAQVDAIAQPLHCLRAWVRWFQNGLGFLVLAGILWTYAGWLPLLLVFTAVPGLLMVGRHILKEHQLASGTHDSGARARYPRLVDHRAERRRRVTPFRSWTLSPKGLRERACWPQEGRLRLVRTGSRNRAGSWNPGLGRQPVAWAGCCTVRWLEGQVSEICCSAFRPSSNARFCFAPCSKALARFTGACFSSRIWMTF